MMMMIMMAMMVIMIMPDLIINGEFSWTPLIPWWRPMTHQGIMSSYSFSSSSTTVGKQWIDISRLGRPENVAFFNSSCSTVSSPHPKKDLMSIDHDTRSHQLWNYELIEFLIKFNNCGQAMDWHFTPGSTRKCGLLQSILFDSLFPRPKKWPNEHEWWSWHEVAPAMI